MYPFRSTQTKYWSIHDVQRYFLGDLHCEQVLFTYQYPNLKMPSRLGNHLWLANTALKLSSSVYMKELHMSIETSFKVFLNQTSNFVTIILTGKMEIINTGCCP